MHTPATDLLPNISASSFKRFSAYITSELGIKMSEAKVPMLQSRLMRRVRTLQLSSFDEYLDHLFHSPGSGEEKRHFIDAVTTNKTDFFREPGHFDILIRTLEAENDLKRHFNVLCAGCSTGQEPYTLAMILQSFALRNSGFSFGITATDISTRALDEARRAVYDEETIQPVPVPLRERFLLRSKDPSKQLFRIVPELRNKITFQRLNFMDATYPFRQTFHAVFFRNVMIYFERDTQQAVVEKLSQTLLKDGLLFTGHSESLSGMNLPLRQISSAVYRKLHTYERV